MSIFGRSSRFSCLPLHCRIEKPRNRYIPRLTRCGSFISSSHSRFFNLATNLFPSALNYEKQCISMFSRSSCSSAESSFQDMMTFRRAQAKHSVLFELSSRKEIPCVLDLCKDYGDVKNVFAFGGRKSKFQVLAEFMHEESAQKLVSDGSLKYEYLAIGFHCRSRRLHFENGGGEGNPSVTSNEITEHFLQNQNSKNSINEQPSSVSELMKEIYETEKISELSVRLRFLSSLMLQEVVSPDCTTFPFGSSVNGFGEDSSDLDIMLRLFPENFIRNPKVYLKTNYVKGGLHAFQEQAVSEIHWLLHGRVPGFHNIGTIKTARVPILRYKHLNLDCDVSINNMSSVYMTEILFYCGELDPRFRPLIFTVKKWARETEITTKDSRQCITNFALSLLVLFFLQSRPFPVFPPLCKLVRLPDKDDYRTCAIEYISGGKSSSPESAFIGQNTENLGVLLEEFFRFLTVFPFKEQRISVVTGDSNPREQRLPGSPICIDYPMGNRNVCSNVPHEQLGHLRDVASATVTNLEKLRADLKITYLMSLLGIADSIPGRTDARAFSSDSQ